MQPKPGQPAKKGKSRQNVLVSATLEKGVSRLIDLALTNPVHVGFDESEQTVETAPTQVESKEQKEQANPEEAQMTLPTALQQQYLRVESRFFCSSRSRETSHDRVCSRHRLVALAAFLRGTCEETAARKLPVGTPGSVLKAIVFFSTCASVDFHFKLFSHAVWPYLDFGKSDMPNAEEKEDWQGGETAPQVEEKKSQSAAKHKTMNGSERKSVTSSADPLIPVPLWKLHGNMPQAARTETYLAFSKAAGGILFCTVRALSLLSF